MSYERGFMFLVWFEDQFLGYYSVEAVISEHYTFVLDRMLYDTHYGKFYVTTTGIKRWCPIPLSEWPIRARTELLLRGLIR